MLDSCPRRLPADGAKAEKKIPAKKKKLQKKIRASGDLTLCISTQSSASSDGCFVLVCCLLCTSICFFVYYNFTLQNNLKHPRKKRCFFFLHKQLDDGTKKHPKNFVASQFHLSIKKTNKDKPETEDPNGRMWHLRLWSHEPHNNEFEVLFSYQCLFGPSVVLKLCCIDFNILINEVEPQTAHYFSNIYSFVSVPQVIKEKSEEEDLRGCFLAKQIPTWVTNIFYLIVGLSWIISF